MDMKIIVSHTSNPTYAPLHLIWQWTKHMSQDCYPYRHQMCFHTDILGIDPFLPISDKEIPNCVWDILISDFINDLLA